VASAQRREPVEVRPTMPERQEHEGDSDGTTGADSHWERVARAAVFTTELSERDGNTEPLWPADTAFHHVQRTDRR